MSPFPGDGIGSDSPFNPDNPGENMIIDGLDPNGSGGGRVTVGSSLLLAALGTNLINIR